MSVGTGQARQLREHFLSAWRQLGAHLHPAMHLRARDELSATLVALAVAAGDVRSYDVLRAEAETEIAAMSASRERSNVVPFPVLRSVDMRQQSDFEVAVVFTYRGMPTGLSAEDQAEVDQNFFAEDLHSLIEVLKEGYESPDFRVSVRPTGRPTRLQDWQGE